MDAAYVRIPTAWHAADAVTGPKKSPPPRLFGQSIGWSEDRETQLVEMWQSGLTGSQIAKRLGGVTRSAVIGKVHRMGMARKTNLGLARKLGAKKSRKRKGAKRPVLKFGRERTEAPVKPSPLPPEREKPAQLFHLADLEDHQCRYYDGDPKQSDGGYCGCATATGSSYCAEHHAVVYQPIARTERLRRSPGDITMWSRIMPTDFEVMGC